MASGDRIRILIADDSAVMRSLLRAVVSSDAGLEVAAPRPMAKLPWEPLKLFARSGSAGCGDARDGWVGHTEKVARAGHRMPVIMCSSLTQRGAKVTIEALASGASDYVASRRQSAARRPCRHSLRI